MSSDPIESRADLRRVEIVEPHDDGVVGGPVVVAAANAGRRKPEAAIEPLGAVRLSAHLEGRCGGAGGNAEAQQFDTEAGAVAFAATGAAAKRTLKELA